MRNFSYIIIVCFLLLGISSGYSQNGYIAGYVITNAGDTLKGQIKDRKFINGTLSWQKVDFIDSLGKKYRYNPDDIKGYGRKGRNNYRTLIIDVEQTKTFLEVQEEGVVILYANNLGSWGGAGNAVLMQTTKDGHKEHFEFFLQKKNIPGSLMQWRPKDYKNTAKIFFKDNPELLKDIEDDKITEEGIRVIVKKYNASKKGN